ncbi:MAG: 2-C-methyl-D-erythritol 4-phosphate cytidylyltransferase [Sphingobacteriaceae bacterium]|nr:2-C-methyl-D-erythritol 4-phosphate cytidylyltransferase [Sphingobacteriaceae bacterium]
MEYYAIIVAGGSGNRMKATLPKQFLLLHGKPILMHSLIAFHKSIFQPHLILVLPKAFHHLWKELCIEHNFALNHTLIEGGEERFFSVQNGLKIVPNQAIVAIHDGVRPLVSDEIIVNGYQTAQLKGNAIPAVTPTDSVRKIDAKDSYILNRDELRLIQTPQVFKSEIIKKAYEQKFDTKFTDDASVVENIGETVHLTLGERKNIKITYPEDLLFAELFFNN